MSRRRSASERVYAALLLLFPRDFRREFGPDMRDLFRDHLHAASRDGPLAVAALWLRTIPDLCITGFREHEDHMIDALKQDAWYALRILRRNPLFAVVAIVVVALGIGAVSTVFSVANAVVLHPIPGVTDPSRLQTIDRTRGDGGGSLSASYAYYEQLAARSRTMSGIAAWEMFGLSVSTGGQGEVGLGNLVSGNYFDVLGVHPALGRFFSGDEVRVPDKYPVAVISHELWQRRFASDSGVVGRILFLNRTAFTIIGVAPARFSGLFSPVRIDAWVPLMMQQRVRRGGRDLLSDRGAFWLELVGRLAPRVSREAARVELAGITRQIATSPESGEPPDLRAFTGVRLTRAMGLPGDAAKPVLEFFVVLLVVAGLLLLIASVNVAGMLLARAAARQREMAVRVALGAARGRLVRQLMTESLVLFVFGGAAGMALAVLGTRLLGRIELPVDVPLSLDLAPDARVAAVTMVVTLATGLLFGLAPALQGTRLAIVATLRGDGAGSGRSRSKLRTVLVVCQVAASLLLLATSGLFVRALARGQRVDIGFDAAHVTIAGMGASTLGYDDARVRRLVAAYRERLAAIPGVTDVAFARLLPLSANTSAIDIHISGYTPPARESRDGTVPIPDDVVDQGYFSVFHIPIVRGRALARTDDEHAARVAVVNEAFARTYWPGKEPIGRTIRIDSTTMTIVGVARDSRWKLGESPKPFLFLPLAQNWVSDLMVLVRTNGDTPSIGAAMIREMHALDAHAAAPVTSTMTESIAVGLLPQRVAVMVTAALGLAGLVLATIGLYGVVAFSTARRTREIGVRVAIGATRNDVLRLVVADGMRLVMIGLGVGLLLAFAVTRLLQPFLFGVSPLDALTFLGVTITLVGATFVASYLPASRAAAIDPVEALRAD